MKITFTKWLQGGALLVLLCLFISVKTQGQVTISTNHINNNNNAMVTFVVSNTNASPVMLTDVSTELMYTGTSTTTLYYYASQINQVNTWSLGQINNGVNGWTLVASQSNNVATTGLQSVLSGVSFVIPAGATYTFALGNSAGLAYMTLGSGVNTFSGGGVNLITGDGVSWGGTALPTTPANYPRGFIGSISIVPMAPCAAPLSAGIINNPPTSICPASGLGLIASGVTFGTGMSYQWQSSTNGITWANIAGATGVTYNQTQSVPTNYRLRSVCSNGNDTVYTPPVYVTMESFVNCYCPASAYYTFDTDIHNVQIGSLSNFNSSGCNDYTDYTTLAAPTLFHSLSYPMTVQVGSCSGSTYDAGVAVFIDYNQNGAFNDPGELVMWTPNTPTAGPLTNHTGTVVIPANAASGITRMRVIALEGYDGNTIDPCTSVLYTYGEVEDYLVQITTQPTAEVALLSIDSPNLSNCSFGNDLKVTIKNNGTSALTSVDFAVNTGGLVQNATWTGNIASMASQQISVPGIFSYNSGDTLGVAVSNPNGTPDVILSDNYKGTRTYLALQGVYKVGYGVNNIDSIADIPTAISRLHNLGACNTVYFDLKPGTYTGRYTLNSYPGWVSGNKVIFRSETKNAQDVILRDSATSTANNYIFLVDGADGIGLQHLTINPRGATYRCAINIKNGANELLVDSCRVLADTSMTGVATNNFDQILIGSFNGTTDHHTTITNNVLRGGSRIINLGAATGDFEQAHIIKGNTITNFGFIGIIVNANMGAQISSNYMRTASNSSLASTTVVQLSNSVGGEFIGNELHSLKPGYAFLASSLQGDTQAFEIMNNFIYCADSSSSNSIGIYVELPSSNHINIVNNSISTRTNMGYGISILDGNNMNIYNNNIGSFGLAIPVSISKTYSILQSNNNNIYSATGTNIIKYGSNTYNSLALWQSAYGMDLNSVSVHPGYTGSDLHTCALALDGAAMPYALNVFDIDGDLRQVASDIGADEFLGSALGLVDQDQFIKCPNESVTMGAAAQNGVIYSWSNGSTGSSLSTIQAGQFIVTATGSCGSFSDTVQVTNKVTPTAAFTIGTGVGLAVSLVNSSSNATSYLWDFGDGNTSTESNPSHIYESSGVYVITLTAYGECDTVTTTSTYNALNVGVESWAGTEISLYPNPTKDQLNLVLKNIGKGQLTMKILDISSKSVYQNTVGVSGSSLLNLDVNSLVPGVYVIQLSMGEMSHVLKFVKQ